MYFIIPVIPSSFSWNVTLLAFTGFFTPRIYPIIHPYPPSHTPSPYSSSPIISLLTTTSPIFLALQDKICSPMWVLLADSNVLLSSMNCQSASSHPVPFLSWPFHSNPFKKHFNTWTVIHRNAEETLIWYICVSILTLSNLVSVLIGLKQNKNQRESCTLLGKKLVATGVVIFASMHFHPLQLYFC